MMVWAALVVNALLPQQQPHVLLHPSTTLNQAQHSTITPSCLLDFGELF
jgi:hypothetical protein